MKPSMVRVTESDHRLMIDSVTDAEITTLDPEGKIPRVIARIATM
ncbi:MAG: hypothetical protein ACREWG_13035 [Gammaproteobacteria bacterium]